MGNFVGKTQLTVSTPAVGFATADVPSTAVAALIQVTGDQAVRMGDVDDVPTTSEGIILRHGLLVPLLGTRNILNVRFIRISGVDTTVDARFLSGYDLPLVSGFPHAGFSQTTSGITTNAEGAVINMEDEVMSKYLMTVHRTAGTTDVVEVDLKVSIDGIDYVQIATVTSMATTPTSANANGYPAQFMQYNVVTVGTGNTLRISLQASR